GRRWVLRSGWPPSDWARSARRHRIAWRSGYRLRFARGRPIGATGAIADRLTDVAQRAGAADVGEDVEVVRLRRREREPLQGVAAPRVVAGLGAVLAAGHGVDDRQQDPDREDEDADRGDHVVGGDAGAGEVLVGVDD